MAAKKPEPASGPSSSRRGGHKQGPSPGEPTAAAHLRVDVPSVQAAEEWQRTFDAVPDPIAILDTQHRIVRVNQAMADRLGLPKQQCVGQTCYRLVHGTDEPPSFCPHSQLLHDGEERTVELHEERVRGDFLVTVAPLRDSTGRLIGSVHLARDITERKRAEEALRDREQRQAEAERLAAVGRMAARAAHEINNPLAGIRNSFRLVRDAVPAEHPDHDMVERIEREIDRISRIVRQMYTLYSPRSERIADLVVADAIRDVLLMLEPMRREHEVQFEESCTPTGLTVRITEGGLHQIMYNLTANALEASPRGGIVTVAAKLADDNNQEHDLVEIAVRDQGGGIPAEIQPRIFEPFVTGKSGDDSGKGLGLGLSVVRSIVEAHGGSIALESTPAHGTVFRVFLPHDPKAKEP